MQQSPFKTKADTIRPPPLPAMNGVMGSGFLLPREPWKSIRQGGQKTVRGTAFPTSKHGKSHYGDKNHVNVDRKHKLIRRYHVSDAALHDCQAVDHLLMQDNTGAGVWADAAYRSEEMEAKLKARKLTSHIHRKGKRGEPLTEQAKGSNQTKSSVRVRVEHVFGAQANDMGGTLVRTIGLARAKARIGMKNLACNIRRLGQLGRLNPCPACPRSSKIRPRGPKRCA